MAESWVRLWAGMTTDPKWKTIARKSGRPVAEIIAVFTHSLMLANESDDRGSLDGWITEDVASALDMDEEHVEAIRAAMDGRVIDQGRLTGWERRQPKREDQGNEQTGAMSAAERKAKQREREKAAAASNVTQCHEASREVTQCHAPEAEAEADLNNLSVVGDLSPTPSRASALPAEFYPDATGVAYAEQRSVPLAVELQAFRNFHQAKGSTFRDWQAAWRTWCDKAVEFGRCRAPPGAPRRMTLSEERERASMILTGRTTSNHDHDRDPRDITGEARRIA